jgi:hypothetical protein
MFIVAKDTCGSYTEKWLYYARKDKGCEEVQTIAVGPNQAETWALLCRHCIVLTAMHRINVPISWSTTMARTSSRLRKFSCPLSLVK